MMYTKLAWQMVTMHLLGLKPVLNGVHLITKGIWAQENRVLT